MNDSDRRLVSPWVALPGAHNSQQQRPCLKQGKRWGPHSRLSSDLYICAVTQACPHSHTHTHQTHRAIHPLTPTSPPSQYVLLQSSFLPFNTFWNEIVKLYFVLLNPKILKVQLNKSKHGISTYLPQNQNKFWFYYSQFIWIISSLICFI